LPLNRVKNIAKVFLKGSFHRQKELIRPVFSKIIGLYVLFTGT
jgi:hypothetical protein